MSKLRMNVSEREDSATAAIGLIEETLAILDRTTSYFDVRARLQSCLDALQDTPDDVWDPVSFSASR